MCLFFIYYYWNKAERSKQDRREGHRLQAVIAARPEVPNRRRLRQQQQRGEGGVIAQTKLDGDRLQAHVRGNEDVKLFTRNGYDVTELYSDVANDLRALHIAAPCIFDGELVAVDGGGSPLPWDNAKWRFNGLFRRPPELEEEEEGGEGWMVEHDETSANNARWELEDSNADAAASVTFIPPADAGRWRTRGCTLRRLPRGSHLRYLIFDALMLHGEDLSGLGCLARWDRLTAPPPGGGGRPHLFASTRFVGLLQESHRVRTAAELLRLLREAARQGTEGLMLKDPAAPYAFGATTVVQKVKLAGPDINAGVVGLGFSLSTTPRRWGLAAAVCTEEEEALEYYCRTDVLEGDAMHRAFQIVHGLQSRVRASQVAEARLGEACVCDGGDYRCVVRSRTPDTVEVEWHAGARVQGRIRFPSQLLAPRSDLQWLCSPWECPFALSLHGDLRPLEGGAPRHPVARVEFTMWQASPSWDSHASVARKFEEARAIETCIERHTLCRIHRLRALPPSRPHLTEVRRIVLGWLSSDKEEEEEERWPQIPPAGFVTARDFTHELRQLRTRLLLPANLAPQQKKLIEDALRDVDPQECLAIADLPSHSQWQRYDRMLLDSKKKRLAQRCEQGDEDDALEAVRAQDPAARAESIARLHTLKGDEPLRWGVLTSAYTLSSEPAPFGPLVLPHDALPVLHDSDYVVLL